MNSVLQVANLTVRYGDHNAVDGISFDVAQGDLLGIVGPNGAGKTTLFRAILGLQSYGGQVRLFGYGPDKFDSLVPLIGYVQQRVSFEPNFPATVSDVVSMGIISERRMRAGEQLVAEHGYRQNRTLRNISKKDERIAAALEAVGLAHLADRRIGELSGGEQQRVFIAKSLIKDPLLLILDEPVTSVDVESQTKFYNAIQEISRGGITIVWSSHDLDALEKYASKVACMNAKMFFHGNKTEFFSDADALRTYTESAMQAHMHDHGEA